jgi:hypothetical protein
VCKILDHRSSLACQVRAGTHVTFRQYLTLLPGFLKSMRNDQTRHALLKNSQFSNIELFPKFTFISVSMGYRKISSDMKECALRLWEAGWTKLNICSALCVSTPRRPAMLFLSVFCHHESMTFFTFTNLNFKVAKHKRFYSQYHE